MTRRLLLCAAVALTALYSCKDVEHATQVSSSGKPYEIFVLALPNVWNSSAGDTVRAIFGEYAEMLNQPEPIYDLYNANPNRAGKTILRHRNLIRMEIDSERYPEPDMEMNYDVYANNQVQITITAPRADSLAQFIARNRGVLVGVFDQVERTRMAERAVKYQNSTINKVIQDKFGIAVAIPRGYTVRNDADNFLWISNEHPLASQGIVFYTFPCDLAAPLDENMLVVERNNAVNKIPGPLEGGYMGTETLLYPQLKHYVINDRRWNEMRGFWKVENDFMGGPFVNYTTIDTVHNRVIAIDMYVYSPTAKYGKRNYVRQLENLIVNVKIPSAAEAL